MSVYFYSKANDGQIAALTGVKCIVLPNRHTPQLDELKNVSSLNEFNAVIDKHLKNTSSPLYKELQEEIEHFKCLTQSRLASFYHIRHLLCRLPFSGTYKKGISQENITPKAIHREIIRYFIGYTTFHKVAFPLVEGHFHSTKNTKKKPKGYSDDVWLARNFVHKHQVTHRELGQIIDYLCLHSNFNVTEEAYHKALNKTRLYNGNSIISYLPEFSHQFIPMLKVHNLPYHMARVIIKNRSLLKLYLKPRLFPDKSHNNNLANTPSIVTYNVITDPTGFATRTAYSQSQEVRLEGNTGAKLNLLWHVLSRLATIYQKLRLGSDLVSIFQEMQLIFDFMFAWKSDAEDILIPAQEIDTRIFQEARSVFSSKNSISIKEIEVIALKLMAQFLESYPELFDKKSFKEYINCSYYHI